VRTHISGGHRHVWIAATVMPLFVGAFIGLAPTPPATAASATASAVAATGCPNVIVIGARGSGETDLNAQGLGPEVKTLYKELSSDLQARKVTTKSLFVVYTAKDAYTLQLTAAEKTILAAAAIAGPAALAAAFEGIAVVYKATQLDPFVASVNEGIASALDELTTEATQCPAARFVLAGYSQGAIVMHQLLLRLADQGNSALLNRISATALIADGDKKKETAAIRAGTSSFEAEGIRSALTLGERDVPTPSSTYDICNAGDLVCDFTVQSLLDFKKAVDIHTSYANSRLVKNIGKRIASDLLAAPVTSVTTTTLPAGQVGIPYVGALTGTGIAPLKWSAVTALPAGLTLSTDGRVSGTPTTSGTAYVDVHVTDAVGGTAVGTVSMKINPGTVPPTPGSHAVINFDDLPQGSITGIVVDTQYPSAQFSSFTGYVNYVSTQPDLVSSKPNFICTGPIGGSIDCTGDTIVTFPSPASGLTLNAIGFDNAGTVAQIDVFGTAGLLGTVAVIGHGTVAPELQDLSAYSGITSIRIRDITDPGGLGWDDFSFDS
jgi:hypothetical protein